MCSLIAGCTDSHQTEYASWIACLAINTFESTEGQRIARLAGEALIQCAGYAFIEGSCAIQAHAIGLCVASNAFTLVVCSV